jgi:hypothetical protein
MGKEV